MSEEHDFARRRFVKLCASAIAAVSASPRILARDSQSLQRFQRVRLVDRHGRPLSVDELVVGKNYIFHYPYVSTPCFLLDLGRAAPGGTQLRTESGQRYTWQGGVGPQRSIVAFSAICAHRMTYPARQVSFINYRHNEARFKGNDQKPVERARVIYCCSEKSVYDPAEGARVLGGPAPQPLAAIELDYDEGDGTLAAVGAYGGRLFDRFVNEFEFQLALELRRDDVRTRVDGSAEVVALEGYTENQVLC